ncbi:MAG: (d)CMP kinase [Myxococcota bacterium]
MRELTIAVDGPGSAGKGTVARGVANALGYRYIDTGAMYRAVAWAAHQRGLSTHDGPALGALTATLSLDFQWDGTALRVWCDDMDVSSEIRSDAMGTAASAVSVHPEVRQALLAQQRAFGAAGGVVMDGRDIGTVVFPNADLKVFLDASLDERARRRHEELVARGEDASWSEVREALDRRDAQDRQRATAPLRPAVDAVMVDTTGLSIDQAIAVVLQLVEARRTP